MRRPKCCDATGHMDSATSAPGRPKRLAGHDSAPEFPSHVARALLGVVRRELLDARVRIGQFRTELLVLGLIRARSCTCVCARVRESARALVSRRSVARGAEPAGRGRAALLSGGPFSGFGRPT